MKRKPEGMVRAAGILLMTQCPAPQFLLMRHSNRWDLPKGHCETGESLVQTALRETFEETGIESRQIELDPDFTFDLTSFSRSAKSANRDKTLSKVPLTSPE